MTVELLPGDNELNALLTPRLVMRRAQIIDAWTSDHNRRSLCRDANGRIYTSYQSWNGTYWRASIGWSDDAGLTWAFEEVPDQPQTNNNGVVCAVDSANSLIVVWEAGAELWYRRKLASGFWEDPIILANPGDHASVAMDGNDTSHIAWRESTGSRDEIRYNTVSATGEVGIQVDITNLGFTRRQVNPMIAVCPANKAIIVWQGTGWGANPDNYNIQYQTVENGILGAQIGITDKPTSCRDPALAVDSSCNVHIVWSDQIDGFGYMNLAYGIPVVINSYTGYGGMSITLDAADNIFAFLQDPGSRVLRIYANRGSGWVEEWTIEMAVQNNDIYSMHSWYPRFGSVSPNVLQDGWLVYAFWPVIDDLAAYLIFEGDLE